MYSRSSNPVWGQTTYAVRTPSGKYAPNAYYDPNRYVPRGHGRSVSYEPQLPPYLYQQQTQAQPLPSKLRPVQTTFASETDRLRTKAAKSSSPKHASKKTASSKKETYTYRVDDFDPRTFDDLSPKGTPPPPYHRFNDELNDKPRDRDFYQSEPPAYKTRNRSASTPQKPTRQESTAKRRSQSAKVPKAPRKATEEDRIRAGIKPGYSLKNWDPAEEHILLLGSVFDANSLGKWIYDWTVFHHGAGAPMADEAGELWLSLINLAQKRKRADEVYSRIRRKKSRVLVKAFLEDADDLWEDFRVILRSCEEFMWNKAEKDSTGKKSRSFGARSGCEFVETIFGRDRELDRTTKVMNEIRVWSYDFDAQCQAILNHPRD